MLGDGSFVTCQLTGNVPKLTPLRFCMFESVQALQLNGLIREVLKPSKSGAVELTVRDTAKHFASFSELDYAAALQALFSRQLFRGVISELRRMLPRLNREVLRGSDLRQLAKVAASLGAVLDARPFKGPQGRTLRGFYVNDRTVLKRPIICLNTAGHPVGVAAAFWHEIGHHLTREIFGRHDGRLNLSFASNYQDHLESPEETIADAVLVLAAYPNAAARRLFGGTEREKANRDIGLLASRALGHLRSVADVEFPTRAPEHENLRILAGTIHLAKLRQAILEEYGV